MHVRASSDADSWVERKERFNRKFQKAQEYYPDLFQFDYACVERIAIVGGRIHPPGISFEGIIIKSVPEFVSEITAVLTERKVAKQAVPEHWSLLRAIQLASAYGVRDTDG